MSAEYCACPFLKEKSHLCDYEIITDRLASMPFVARHHIRHIPWEDFPQPVETIYHANGSIRGVCVIGGAEPKKLNAFYIRYHVEVDRLALPSGCIGASHLHVLHAEAKAVIRIMHQVQCEGEPAEIILLDFMNLLPSIFFVMYLYENARDDIGEREFINRSYV